MINNRTEEVCNFENLIWLFSNNNLNRGIIRLNFDEAALLWKSVKISKGNILEIGRRRGGSTVLISCAANARKITSIDIAPNHHQKCEDYFALVDNIEFIVDDSRKPLTGNNFGLIFIDGDHSYEGVLKDTLVHWPELKNEAYAIYHDAVPNDGLIYKDKINHCPGVKMVTDDLISSGCAKFIESAGSMLLLKKTHEIPNSFPCRNQLFNDPLYADNQPDYKNL